MGSGRSEDITYLRGDRRIAAQRSGQLMETNVDDGSYIDGAQWDSGMPAKFSAQNMPHCAKLECGSCREMGLFAYLNTVEDEETPSPFLINPSITPAGPPIGAVAAVGKLTIGNCGTSRTQLVNMSPGQAIKLAFLGSSGLFGPILVPKYFNPDDTGTPRIYRIGPGAGAPLVTNDSFNNPQQTDLQAVIGAIPAQQDALTDEATCLAFIGRGSAYGGDSFPKATRKFFASVPVGVVPLPVQCPVAWGCTHVQLVGPATMTFVQETALSLLNLLAPLGPFPANLQTPLADDVVAIRVTSGVAIVGAEVPFELHYTPGL